MCKQKQYLCIDLKSFYASVECVDRGLDPMTTDLVVADPERTDKTICLAVSPSLKAKGVKNRCRLFEIPCNMDYIIAPPRMQRYIDYSAAIYGIYLKYFAAEDIHVYSIDEVFIDVTSYLLMYNKTAVELAFTVMEDICLKTGIRATCGVGTNLYLAKVALDITAKHAANFIGVLDEESYKETLWTHIPLTDFWRIGSGTAARLNKRGIYTMRDIANADEDLLYKLFGIDAELIIDHAWGREPTTIADIKRYTPKSNCISSGQVLMRNYTFEEGLIIIKEMAEALTIELNAKRSVARSFTLHLSYSTAPPYAHGSINLPKLTGSATEIINAFVTLYKKTAPEHGLLRRVNVTANEIQPESAARQISLFDDPAGEARASSLQNTVNGIKYRFGKNSVLRGTSIQEGATMRERNRQIGGHKSG